jgi:hypothetical protein
MKANLLRWEDATCQYSHFVEFVKDFLEHNSFWTQQFQGLVSFPLALGRSCVIREMQVQTKQQPALMYTWNRDAALGHPETFCDVRRTL